MATFDRKPRDDELEVYGLTNSGKVRETNQDHFLICSLNKRLRIHATSLPRPQLIQFRGERLAFMAVVADGVGGHQAGEEASRLALETVARYITQTMDCYYSNDPDQENRFREQLHESVMNCHARVAEEAKDDPARSGMATTLTLAIGHWPWAYVVQVGDSRCYLLQGGELHQVTRDQTVAQVLCDEGVLTSDEAEHSSWSSVLSSAIGGDEAAPATSRISLDWDDVMLLCSDGLTRHVSNEQIRERLRTMTSAREACEALIGDALDDGGRDNVTVVVGRAVKKDRP